MSIFRGQDWAHSQYAQSWGRTGGMSLEPWLMDGAAVAPLPAPSASKAAAVRLRRLVAKTPYFPGDRRTYDVDAKS